MAESKYFREELAFLKEQGKEFADIYPQLARYLYGKNSDPDVERLLEGFAFLTGRLREKIDDEFPELTHSMINMLWPNYLRPMPSTCIIRFIPDRKTISHKQVVAKGCALDSSPTEGQVCRFRTCRDVDVYPLIIERTTASHSQEHSVLDIHIEALSELSLQEIGLDKLRFYLGGQDYSAKTIYLWLNHSLSGIELICGESNYKLPGDCLTPVGFESQDGILPYPKNVYEGYRVLQEFLSVPEAFLFFDINKIAKSVPNDMKGDFKLRIKFSRTLPADVRITEESIQLYCVPAINLFEHDADPINLDGRRTEYRVTPSGRERNHFEIFSIDRVEGWLDSEEGRVRGQARIYTPFESFAHEIERSRQRLALYYRIRARTSMQADGFDHYISFVRSDETMNVNLTEAISLQLTCSNRQLPLALGKGDISVATDDSPGFVSFENITEPTASLAPPLDGSLLWTLISNLSLNYLSILSRDALCTVIRAYDFKALVDRQAENIAKQRMEGIVSIESAPVQRLIRGVPCRGLRSEIRLMQSCFASEGDLYLFGAVMSRFFALYASINSFHELVVVNESNQERYTWKMQCGQQPLI